MTTVRNFLCPYFRTEAEGVGKIKELYCALLFFLLSIHLAFAQKKNLDTAAISNWQYADGGQISNDGAWVSYRINYGFPPTRGESIITSIKHTYAFRFAGFNPPSFSEDSRYAVFMQEDKNELCLLKLGNEQPEKIEGVNSFELAGDSKNSYVLYEKKAAPGDVHIRALFSGREAVYRDVKNRRVIGSHVLMTMGSDNDGYEITMINLSIGSKQKVWSGNVMPENIVISGDNEKLAFKIGSNLWLSDLNKGTAATQIQLPQNNSLNGMRFSGIGGFKDGSGLLLLEYHEASTPNIDKDANPVEIFSYQDARFELNEGFHPSSCQVIYDLASNQIVQLNQSSNQVEQLLLKNSIVLTKGYHGGEYYWNNKQQNKLIQIQNSATDNQIKKDLMVGFLHQVSKDEQYYVYNVPYGDIYSLHIPSGGTINLTQGLPIPSVDNFQETPRSKNNRGVEFRGWVSFQTDADYIFVNDHYDIWLIDITGKTKPLCLTGGYGRIHRIVFSLLDRSRSFLKKGDKIYLKAFDEGSKEAGFFQVNWKNLDQPEMLSMGPYMYADALGGQGEAIIKVKNLNRWLVSRQSATESANFFWTDDFKKFHQVSDVHPEKDYNWLTAELINYTTKDGVKSQAILYKPENLDTTEKYPVLFNFYEQETFKLNSFPKPSYTNQFYFNFPMMIAQGYLVCVSDIHFKLGATARSIVDCVEGAGNAIAKRSYVDSSKYGASGGSFGGYGVNCLAAFSHKFKAIVPVSGISDLVSMYGNFPGLRDEEVENRQCRMGISLSTAPIQYLVNSPVAFAKDVTAPLLIVNTLHDGNANVQQGIEWFISLRREGRPAWMLRYQEHSHGLELLNTSDNKDLYLRMSQFFDHYLKGAPTPKWMMDSLPIWERSGAEGFKLMPPGVEPGPGLNTEEDLQRRAKYLTDKAKSGTE